MPSPQAQAWKECRHPSIPSAWPDMQLHAPGQRTLFYAMHSHSPQVAAAVHGHQAISPYMSQVHQHYPMPPAASHVPHRQHMQPHHQHVSTSVPPWHYISHILRPHHQSVREGTVIMGTVALPRVHCRLQGNPHSISSCLHQLATLLLTISRL